LNLSVFEMPVAFLKSSLIVLHLYEFIVFDGILFLS